MSRIGKAPIKLDEKVQVTLSENNEITVKGPLGELKRTIHESLLVEIKNQEVIITAKNSSKETNMMHGLMRSLVANMVEGVTKGYEKGLVAHGVGYRAQKQGNKLILNVGYSHPVEVVEPDGIKIEILPAKGNSNVIELSVKGIDKEKVGQCAANIRAIRKPEPYHGYGIRYRDEVIVRKEGKAAAK